MTQPSGLGELLDWDSKFFGLRIGRLNAEELTPEAWAEAVDWMDRESLDCLYFLADPNAASSADLAHEVGLRFVDIRVTFERRLPGEAVAMPAGIRCFTPADVEPLAEIAAVSHRDSRFYFDPRFDRGRCDDLYRTWVENSCAGYADEVLVAEVDGRPVGYLTCHANDDGSGQIGLVAVGESAQGRGLGQALVQGHLSWCQQKGKERAVVVTQGRNVPAMRLYEKSGYRTRSVRLWYHYWRT